MRLLNWFGRKIRDFIEQLAINAIALIAWSVVFFILMYLIYNPFTHNGIIKWLINNEVFWVPRVIGGLLLAGFFAYALSTKVKSLSLIGTAFTISLGVLGAYWVKTSATWLPEGVDWLFILGYIVAAALLGLGMATSGFHRLFTNRFSSDVDGGDL